MLTCLFQLDRFATVWKIVLLKLEQDILTLILTLLLFKLVAVKTRLFT
jgi:hypothetical protein